MRKMRPVNQSECRHGQFEGFRVLATHLATQRELSDVCDFCIQSLRRLLRCFPQKKNKKQKYKNNPFDVDDPPAGVNQFRFHNWTRSLD